jgi:PTS system nitrogen regulatory IIA component
MTQPSKDALLLSELVQYVQLPPRVLDRLAKRGVLPGSRVAGRWRFSREEVDRWLDLGMPGWSDGNLQTVARALPQGGPSLASALRVANVFLDLPVQSHPECFTRVVASLSLPPSVDRGLLTRRLAQREALCSTALDHGFAVPHTSRAGPRLVPENIVAFARMVRPIAFGAHDGEGTDLFFFVFATEQAAHLGLLSKVVMLARFPLMARLLRAAKTPEDVVAELRGIERWLFTGEVEEE